MIDREYLAFWPSVIPDGQVLVHNHIKPTKRIGARGFRIWLQVPTTRLERCQCHVSDLPHYRVRFGAPNIQHVDQFVIR